MNPLDVIDLFDWLLVPFYILIIYVLASNYSNRNRESRVYSYFVSGVMVKVLGALALCFVYLFYYKTGGDTLNYQNTSVSLINLAFNDFSGFLEVWLGPNTPEAYSHFSHITGFPAYWNDTNAFNVVRLMVPLTLIGMKSYLATSVLMAFISFSGVWKLYRLFCEIYPSLYKQFAFAVLFIPSVVFWGSGILKDSWTLAAAGWFSYSFYMLFIRQERWMYHALTIVVASIILIMIKPYIFVALMPGCLIWGMWNRILAIKNLILRFVFVPFILVLGLTGGVGLWGLVATSLGDYSTLDGMIKKAATNSEDLKQAYYQGNSFDIGSYDPTLAGIASKFPIAAYSGLFRPAIWEAKNIVMLFSGIENLILMMFFLYVFMKNPVNNISMLFRHPLVLFAFAFALFFAFSVAISTSNFGALVRLRIPLLPFFVSALMILNYLKDVNTDKELNSLPDQNLIKV